MGDINAAFNAVIAACEDAYIGYSQARRTSITLGVSYNTYCDCSSLMAWALTIGGYFTSNPWFATGTEQTYLASAGWYQVTDGTILPGDILWRSGHTEMVYSAQGSSFISMGAHTDGVSFANQVSINSYYSSMSSWSSIWRASDSDGATGESLSWIGVESSPLNETQMNNNASIIWGFLRTQGFSDAAVAGILGNFEGESSINPQRWQNESIGSTTLGYGLAQWTPSTKITNWLSSNGYSSYRTDANEAGNGEMTYLIETWASECPNLSIETYKAYTSAYDAGEAFAKYYERGTGTGQGARAEGWYTKMQNGTITPGYAGDAGTKSTVKPWIPNLRYRFALVGRF